MTSLEKNETKTPLKKPSSQLWLSVSESAKFGGVDSKTIRRAIKSKKIKYKVSEIAMLYVYNLY